MRKKSRYTYGDNKQSNVVPTDVFAVIGKIVDGCDAALICFDEDCEDDEEEHDDDVDGDDDGGGTDIISGLRSKYSLNCDYLSFDSEDIGLSLIDCQ